MGRLYALASVLPPHLATAHSQPWLGGHRPPRPRAWLSDLCLSCRLGCLSGGLQHSFLFTSGPWLSSYQRLLLLSLLRYLFLLKMVLNSGFLSSVLIPSPLPSTDSGCSHCLLANNPYSHIPQTEHAQAYTLVLPECLSGTSSATRCKPNSPASQSGAALPPGSPSWVHEATIHSLIQPETRSPPGLPPLPRLQRSLRPVVYQARLSLLYRLLSNLLAYLHSHGHTTVHATILPR